MQVFHSIQEYKGTDPLAITIGTYDGLHVGHRVILSTLRRIAYVKNQKTALITFEPHPRIALNKDVDQLKLLTSTDEKVDLLSEEGIDYLFVLPFNETLRNVDPDEFVREWLVRGLGMKSIVIGYDHRFGKDRSGDIGFLRSLSSELAYDVEEIPAQQIEQLAISSTQIRKALFVGDILLANTQLSKPYMITGTVVKGDQIGRTLGFPTANIYVSESFKLIPPDGIYAVRVQWSNRWLNGMLYIGHRPSIEGGGEQRIEVHIFDFDQDIYDETIRLWLFKFMRPDKTFSSVDELTLALKADEDAVRAYFR